MGCCERVCVIGKVLAQAFISWCKQERKRKDGVNKALCMYVCLRLLLRGGTYNETIIFLHYLSLLGGLKITI